MPRQLLSARFWHFYCLTGPLTVWW